MTANEFTIGMLNGTSVIVGALLLATAAGIVPVNVAFLALGAHLILEGLALTLMGVA